jgi:hypothetical protein
MKRKWIGMLTVVVFALSIGGVSAAEPNGPKCVKQKGGGTLCEY